VCVPQYPSTDSRYDSVRAAAAGGKIRIRLWGFRFDGNSTRTSKLRYLLQVGGDLRLSPLMHTTPVGKGGVDPIVLVKGKRMRRKEQGM